MTDASVNWSPRYTITPATARGLMAIEAARAVVERTTLLSRRGTSGPIRYRQFIGNTSAV